MATSAAPPESRIFAASRKFGGGSVVVYAQDALTLDEEITDGSDNLLFAQNALAWLTPLESKAGLRRTKITILVWEGTFAKLARMQRVRDFIARRGWVLQTTATRDARRRPGVCRGAVVSERLGAAGGIRRPGTSR